MKRMTLIFALLFLASTAAIACNQPGCNQNKGPAGMFVHKVFKALSYLDIKDDDITDIRLSAKLFKKDMYQIKQAMEFPVDAFNDEELDQKAFLAHCETQQKKMALAKYDFLDSVYTVLSKEQKAQFLKEMKSVTNMKKYGSGRGGFGMGCGPGKGMGPGACDGKGPRKGMM